MRDRFVPLLLLLLHTATTTLSTSSRALFPSPPSTNISVNRLNNSALDVFLAFDEYGDTLPNASADLRYVFTHATSSTFAKVTVLGERYVYAGPPKIRVLASDYDNDKGLSKMFPNPTQSVSYFSVQLQRAEAEPSRNGTKNNTLPPAYVTIATYYSLPWVSTEICSNGLNYLNDTNSAGDLEPKVRLWTCNLCPKRAACPGGNANYWHNVRAKFGSWRENQANRGISNFSKCLAPVMCLGEPNLELRNRFLDPETGEDLALQVRGNATEGCNTERGAYGPLCGQCIHGYYRATNTFECTKCGDVGLILGLILLALVILVAVISVCRRLGPSSLPGNLGTPRQNSSLFSRLDTHNTRLRPQ